MVDVRLGEQIEFGCHGLALWSFTLNAFSYWRLSLSWKREPPRRKAVDPQALLTYFVAANVSLHGARPWHLFIEE
jgi:hypothetical protein